jgi:hypothetical protein
MARVSSEEREVPQDKPVASIVLWRRLCSDKRNDPRDKPVALDSAEVISWTILTQKIYQEQP